MLVVHVVCENESKKTSCRDPGSNQGPLDLQSNALPTELSRPVGTVTTTYTSLAKRRSQADQPYSTCTCTRACVAIEEDWSIQSKRRQDKF